MKILLFLTIGVLACLKPCEVCKQALDFEKSEENDINCVDCGEVCEGVKSVKDSNSRFLILYHKYNQPSCHVCMQLGYCEESECVEDTLDNENEIVISVNSEELEYLKTFPNNLQTQENIKTEDIRKELQRNEERLTYLSKLILNK
ncbi:unnamed protein product [Blepharisma stoltei]|uniref:Uncharacterized protein n=1 Tax=Blepharisma stoltei TaxID=1481888 RepID=A0AAU9JQC8_9CILI|nr:unnamed protein product [Blepharisma stoltei]